jgi:hypothetical protein
MTKNDEKIEAEAKDKQEVQEVQEEQIKPELANQNIIRRWAFEFNGKINKSAALGYMSLHMFFIAGVTFVFMFNTNILLLCVLLIFVTLDAAAIVFLHGCPLTHLERKYLGVDDCEMRRKVIEKCSIFYKCEHEYEKQVEVMINIWSMIASKILVLLICKTFNWKFVNYDNFYV